MKYPLVPLVSISMGSQASEDHEEDPGHCDELLHTSSSSADVCDTAESSVTPVNSRLLPVCHGSSVDFTKGPSDICSSDPSISTSQIYQCQISNIHLL